MKTENIIKNLPNIALYLSGEYYGYYRNYFPKIEFIYICIGYSEGILKEETFDLIQKFTKTKQEFYFEALNLLKRDYAVLNEIIVMLLIPDEILYR